MSARTLRASWTVAPALVLLLLLVPAPAEAGPDRAAVLCTLEGGRAALPDLACPAAIRPGSFSNMCTLNFVVTDGMELYIGAAGHCAGLGGRLTVPGLPGELGTVVYRRNELFNGDWAFIRIDPEDRGRVDPTMCRFAGPSTGPTGVNVRSPLPAEIVFHYGHGVSAGSMEPTRGRAGPVVLPLAKTFFFVSSVDGGDSGSPVRLATGEAAGIAVATVVPGYAPNPVVASRFDVAMAELSASLGKAVALVEGQALPDAPVA